MAPGAIRNGGGDHIVSYMAGLKLVDECLKAILTQK